MKTYAYLSGAAALIIIGAIWILNTRINTEPGPRACTADAKLCPDGSYVGRTGPNCEFAECPSVATTTAVFLQARIGQEVSGLDVSIMPLAVLEDSRCPIGVQCIQAGTVRMRARLSSGLGVALQEFSIDRPVTTEVEEITLISVNPLPAAGVKIKESDYLFEFKITKRPTDIPGIVPYTSGVKGTVFLGPTCPVEQDPPDPGCADKPYQTRVTVQRKGASAMFAEGRSDESGTYTFALPPGSYVLTAEGGAVLPRCNPKDIVVPPTGYITADISCDTGIR